MKIAVVGGGTAGWSAAALLSANAAHDITVLDPSSIAPIGVGESTLPYLQVSHRAMGFSALLGSQWLKDLDATVKLTISFEHFHRIGSTWIHPFTDPYHIDRGLIVAAVNGYGHPMPGASAQMGFIQAHTYFGKLQSKGFITPEDWVAQNRYAKLAAGGAFHLDALRYAALLKRLCLSRTNVTSMDASVGAVRQKPSGAIDHLSLLGGGRLEADLYIDCTGFSALLSEAVGAVWESVSDQLLVDHAWVVQLPYRDVDVQRFNRTQCTALTQGWVFHIPLASRIGTGYIYASRYIDHDDACEELRTYLAQRWGYVPERIEPRRIAFKTGYRPKLWHHNVVAIGLSGFFCEPIESTAIALGQMAALELSRLLALSGPIPDGVAERFNALMLDQHLSVLTFVQWHYGLSERRDSAFWRAYGDMPMSSAQQALMTCFKQAPLTHGFDGKGVLQALGLQHSMFHEASWAMLMMGYGVRQAQSLTLERAV
jgi:tryptophan halogenase